MAEWGTKPDGSGKHVWGLSRLNHGNKQCIHCLCTDLEAAYALGELCPDNMLKAANENGDANE